jgi:predicted kinase
MLIGIQGSGKTTFASDLNKTKGIEIVSTDIVRMHNPGIEEANVWVTVYDALAAAVKANRDVIFDATNITPKVRKRMFDELNKRNVIPQVAAYYLMTDKDECYHRVVERNKDTNNLYLPPEVVYSYSERLIEPCLEEGFTYICKVVNGKIYETIKK